MSDNILSAVLTFSLLAGGTAAIGSEVFESRQVALASTPVVVMPQVTITAPRARPTEIVTMPQVTITAQRAAEPAALVTLPMVVVTGKRETLTVAVETRASESPRVE
jgi:hypothetical protein